MFKSDVEHGFGLPVEMIEPSFAVTRAEFK